MMLFTFLSPHEVPVAALYILYDLPLPGTLHDISVHILSNIPNSGPCKIMYDILLTVKELASILDIWSDA